MSREAHNEDNQKTIPNASEIEITNLNPTEVKLRPPRNINPIDPPAFILKRLVEMPRPSKQVQYCWSPKSARSTLDTANVLKSLHVQMPLLSFLRCGNSEAASVVCGRRRTKKRPTINGRSQNGLVKQLGHGRKAAVQLKVIGKINFSSSSLGVAVGALRFTGIKGFWCKVGVGKKGL